MSTSEMKAAAGTVAASIAFAALSLATNIALSASPAAASGDLDVTMDVIDTMDDVAGAKEIEVGEAKESSIAGKESATTDKDSVQQEVQSGAQGGPDGA